MTVVIPNASAGALVVHAVQTVHPKQRGSAEEGVSPRSNNNNNNNNVERRERGGNAETKVRLHGVLLPGGTHGVETFLHTDTV